MLFKSLDPILFEKWNGAGNDFVLFSDTEDAINLTPEIVKNLCDRHFGVGADGVIRITKGNKNYPLFMDYWNSDGTLAEMCGNGIRCLAAFSIENGLINASKFKVGTRAGVKDVEVLPDNIVRVNMGHPIFNPSEIPLAINESIAIDIPLKVAAVNTRLSAVSVGNPHAVVFKDDPGLAVKSLGKLIETAPIFPEKTNVEFVKVLSANCIQMSVWERGVGETLACGTGACAAAVISHILKQTDSKVCVVTPGGDLEVEWEGSLDEKKPIFLAGPVAKNFEGKYYI